MKSTKRKLGKSKIAFDESGPDQIKVAFDETINPDTLTAEEAQQAMARETSPDAVRECIEIIRCVDPSEAHTLEIIGDSNPQDLVDAINADDSLSFRALANPDYPHVILYKPKGFLARPLQRQPMPLSATVH